MTTRSLKPIAAFDVIEGNVTPITSHWPSPEPATGYRWLHLDMKDPSPRVWSDEHLPEVAARSLTQSETRPRCERHADGLILNLRGVNLNPEADPEDMVSLRMWVTTQSVTSVRMRKVWAVDTLRQEAEAGGAPATVGSFLVWLTDALTDRIEAVSLGLEEETDKLEELIAYGLSLTPSTLGNLRQAVIKIRRFVNPQREAIATLASVDSAILNEAEAALMREIANRTRRIVEELDTNRERLTALQDHLDTERTQILSRNSYVLSVIAAIFLPLGFLTGLFGVNVAGMPGTTAPNAFWLLTGFSVASGIALYLVFKLSKWL